jgi:signal transduction histidine kinase
MPSIHVNPVPPLPRQKPDVSDHFKRLVLLLVTLFFAGMALLIGFDYNRSVTEAERQLAYFSELFGQSVESSIRLANVEMSNAIDRLADAELSNDALVEERYGNLLRASVTKIAQIDRLALITPEGQVVWAMSSALVGQNLSDRGYFQSALRLPRGQFAVGVPILSRGTGLRLTPIAWPLIASNGTVRGVVASSLGERYFLDLLTLEDVPEDMQVNVLASNGEAAFISNPMPRDATTSGISAMRAIPSLGLTIYVTRSKMAVLRGFSERVIYFSLIAVGLFAAAIGTAVHSQRKSVLLAEGLQRSQSDNRRILLAQREFNAVFDNVGDGIVIYDRDGSFSRSNKKARELLREGGNEAATNALRQLLPDISKMENDFAVHELRLPDREDAEEEHLVQCRVMKLEANGTMVAYCVLTDVSAEQRLAAARTKFITSINHELRTPLTSLSGSIEVLQQRFGADLPQGADKLVAMAARNADRLLILVNEILTLQAIDQGQLQVRSEVISIDAALDEATVTNSGYGLGRKVALLREPSAAGTIMADPVRLQQVFSNLISNAVKYSPEGGKVTLGATQADGKVSFFVRDKGPGIPASARARLFDRFAKPVHGKDVQASGTGLGLAISKQLVERQGGQIDFDSQVAEAEGADHGTTFFVTFPLCGGETKEAVI